MKSGLFLEELVCHRNTVWFEWFELYLSVYLLTQEMFMEHLLPVKHCSRDLEFVSIKQIKICVHRKHSSEGREIIHHKCAVLAAGNAMEKAQSRPGELGERAGPGGPGAGLQLSGQALQRWGWNWGQPRASEEAEGWGW